MSKLIDLTGNRYCKLVVIERAENTNRGEPRWKCKCDCGNITTVKGQNLKHGLVKSCGCLRSESNKSRTKHGLSNDPLYIKWNSIKVRCYDPSCKSYKDYGGRGIKMCDEWKNSVDEFAKWAYSSGYNEDLTIERIDNNGDYCPENCRWVTKMEQAKNRRSNYKIAYNGKTQDLTDWCKDLGLDYKLIHNRIHKSHWSFERAISEPVHAEKRNRKG